MGYIGNSNPDWLIFFRGVETTNQKKNNHFLTAFTTVLLCRRCSVSTLLTVHTKISSNLSSLPAMGRWSNAVDTLRKNHHPKMGEAKYIKLFILTAIRICLTFPCLCFDEFAVGFDRITFSQCEMSHCHASPLSGFSGRRWSLKNWRPRDAFAPW